MKNFWNENGKIVGKLILNQFGAAFFGIVLLLACQAATTIKLKLELFSSIFSTLFYLFLLYNVMWEKGGQDRIRVDGGRAPKMLLKGLYISLLANIPNIILGLLVVISDPFKATAEWAGNMNMITRVCCLIWESMYAGLVAHFSPYNPIAHLLDILPALLVCGGAYYIGHSNKRLLGFLNFGKEKK